MQKVTSDPAFSLSKVTRCSAFPLKFAKACKHRYTKAFVDQPIPSIFSFGLAFTKSYEYANASRAIETVWRLPWSFTNTFICITRTVLSGIPLSGSWEWSGWRPGPHVHSHSQNWVCHEIRFIILILQLQWKHSDNRSSLKRSESFKNQNLRIYISR